MLENFFLLSYKCKMTACASEKGKKKTIKVPTKTSSQVLPLLSWGICSSTGHQFNLKTCVMGKSGLKLGEIVFGPFLLV